MIYESDLHAHRQCIYPCVIAARATGLLYMVANCKKSSSSAHWIWVGLHHWFYGRFLSCVLPLSRHRIYIYERCVRTGKFSHCLISMVLPCICMHKPSQRLDYLGSYSPSMTRRCVDDIGPRLHITKTETKNKFDTDSAPSRTQVRNQMMLCALKE